MSLRGPGVGAAAEDFAHSNYVSIDYDTQQFSVIFSVLTQPDPVASAARHKLRRVIYSPPTQARVRVFLLLHPRRKSSIRRVESAPCRTVRPTTPRLGDKQTARSLPAGTRTLSTSTRASIAHCILLYSNTASQRVLKYFSRPSRNLYSGHR